MWFVDIAYDEIPERHYKESEVSGVQTVTSGPPKVKAMRTLGQQTHRKMEKWWERQKKQRGGGQME